MKPLSCLRSFWTRLDGVSPVAGADPTLSSARSAGDTQILYSAVLGQHEKCAVHATSQYTAALKRKVKSSTLSYELTVLHDRLN